MWLEIGEDFENLMGKGQKNLSEEKVWKSGGNFEGLMEEGQGYLENCKEVGRGWGIDVYFVNLFQGGMLDTKEVLLMNEDLVEDLFHVDVA